MANRKTGQAHAPKYILTTLLTRGRRGLYPNQPIRTDMGQQVPGGMLQLIRTRNYDALTSIGVKTKKD